MHHLKMEFHIFGKERIFAMFKWIKNIFNRKPKPWKTTMVFSYAMVFDYEVPEELRKELTLKICDYILQMPNNVVHTDPRIEDINYQSVIMADILKTKDNVSYSKVDHYVHSKKGQNGV